MKDNNNNNNGMATAAMVGVAGAVVGAGAAIAANKIMHDDKMRGKVVGALNNAKEYVAEVMDAAHTKADDVSEQIEEKTDKAKKQLDKKS